MIFSSFQWTDVIENILYKNCANPDLFWFIFVLFTLPTIKIKIEKALIFLLGTRHRGRKLVGSDGSTELWRPPNENIFFLKCHFNTIMTLLMTQNNERVARSGQHQQCDQMTRLFAQFCSFTTKKICPIS